MSLGAHFPTNLHEDFLRPGTLLLRLSSPSVKRENNCSSFYLCCGDSIGIFQASAPGRGQSQDPPSSCPTEARADPVKACPVSGGLARTSMDDQLLRLLRDLRIEVVHQHPQRNRPLFPCFLMHRPARCSTCPRAGEKGGANVEEGGLTSSGAGHGRGCTDFSSSSPSGHRYA